MDGGNTELLAAPEYSAIQIPDDMSFEEAAAAPLVFLTAWHMLMARAKLQPGEDVLVLVGIQRRGFRRHPDRQAASSAA